VRRTRGFALLVGTAAVTLVLCAGCRDSAAQGTSVPPADTVTSSGGSTGSTGSGDSAGELGSQLDDIQSTVDGIQSQVDSDSTP
jgi:hypothetical protein